MDEASFQKELNKYKVVRGADYCKVRASRSRADTKSSPRQIQSSQVRERNEAVLSTAVGTNFWESMSTANSSVLTTAESIKFIEALRQVRINHIWRLNGVMIDLLKGTRRSR